MKNPTVVEKPKGVLDIRRLPHKEFNEKWDKTILPDETKEQLLAHLLLELTLRSQVRSRASVPLHGIILLVGPPGTGKTTIAKGAASKAAALLKGSQVNFLEVEPHELTSSALGKSQGEIRRLLDEVITEHAMQGPLIVLLDEVETLVSDRAKMSMEANPVDVHRATDAMLAGLDNLAAKFPELVFIATSNFEGAIDPAFISRADLILRIDKPTRGACEEILRDTLHALAENWPELKKLIKHTGFAKAVDDAVGLDGRQIRKAVINALTYSTDLVINPGELTIQHLHKSIKQADRN